MVWNAAAERLKGDDRPQHFLYVHNRLQRFEDTVLANGQTFRVAVLLMINDNFIKSFCFLNLPAGK
ncbi:hypothetical protein D3C80_2168360 [compost metagenome]